VTNDSKERSDDNEEDTDGGFESKLVAIDGMDIVTGNDGHGAMLFSKASMEELRLHASTEGTDNMEEDFEAKATSGSEDYSWKDEAKEVSQLTAEISKATTQIQFESEEETSDGSDFKEDDLSFRSDDLDLKLSDYKSADEVSSGEFDARFTKRYSAPNTFLQALWNTAGPSAGAMRICLEIIKEELQGQLEGVPAEFRDLPESLIDLLYEEGGKDPRDAMSFITQIHADISKYEDDEEEKVKSPESHVKTIQYDDPDPASVSPKQGERGAQEQEASKTHGPTTGAQQTSPKEGAVINPANNAGGDEEGAQSRSMAGNE